MKKVQKIDKVKVVAGRLIKVVNTEKPVFSNANNQYFALWVENADGSNERCLLLSEKELARAEHRASKNPEDLPKKGFWTNLFD
ncbi:MAG: hypothetical protein WC375_09045 [Methanomassiliicoccales archaeon]|jgi:hypothetical protein